MTVFRSSSLDGVAGTVPSASSEGYTTSVNNNGSIVYEAGGGIRIEGQNYFSHTYDFPATKVYWKGLIKFGSIPATNRMLVSWNSSETVLTSLGIDTSGKIRLRNSAGTTTSTSTTVLVPGKWYGIIHSYTPSDGSQTAEIFDGVSKIETLQGAGTSGVVAYQREGILQGDVNAVVSFNDTSTSDVYAAFSSQTATFELFDSNGVELEFVFWDGKSLNLLEIL